MAELKRRAVTDAQKQFRRQEILDGARAYFEASGYEGFTMTQLAGRLGIVKGTLYLYFPTKEAIILALYARALEDWCEAVKVKLATPIAGDDFVQLFYDTATADPILIPILTRLEHVIEHNISVELLVEAKRHFQTCFESIADKTQSALGLAPEQARELILTLGVLLSGASQSDQGPSLEGEVLPQDVLDFIDTLSSERIFVTNGRRILAGIRGGR
jgi:AcrR family transcriptional regulator